MKGAPVRVQRTGREQWASMTMREREREREQWWWWGQELMAKMAEF